MTVEAISQFENKHQVHCIGNQFDDSNRLVFETSAFKHSPYEKYGYGEIKEIMMFRDCLKNLKRDQSRKPRFTSGRLWLVCFKGKR